MRPVDALRQCIYYLDRELAPGSKVRAFAHAAGVVDALDGDELRARVDAGTLTELDGIGPSTAEVIADAVLGRSDGYLARLERRSRVPLGEGAPVRAALRGDLHVHTSWSDGSVPVRTVVDNARALGHDYVVITDHSPRLTVAHGLDEARLARQLDEIAALNDEVAPFRVLTGMEVDICEDGSLDLSDEMLARLDVVVASVHSKFRMPAAEMTRRLVTAVASPHVDVLGHCTNRIVAGKRGRPPSEFDAEIVFAACARFTTAVEINCRPERQDPPDALLDLALDWRCPIAVSTDAHSPGQMEWLAFGCDKAARHGIDPDAIVNTWPVERLLAWTASHPSL